MSESEFFDWTSTSLSSPTHVAFWRPATRRDALRRLVSPSRIFRPYWWRGRWDSVCLGVKGRGEA